MTRYTCARGEGLGYLWVRRLRSRRRNVKFRTLRVEGERVDASAIAPLYRSVRGGPRYSRPVQLHPAFVASIHGLPRPGVRASHDARWLKVWPLHRHRAELGLPVARSLSPVGSASVDSCASSCFRPRHAGARRVLLAPTGNSYGVSRRSRQPCAPFAVRIAGFVLGTSRVPDHVLACGLPSSHVATEEAVTSSSVSPMVDGVRLLFAFFFPS
eukprot:scaffold15652_cov151-Isochrysis_galbana.AAC.2